MRYCKICRSDREPVADPCVLLRAGHHCLVTNLGMENPCFRDQGNQTIAGYVGLVG